MGVEGAFVVVGVRRVGATAQTWRRPLRNLAHRAPLRAVVLLVLLEANKAFLALRVVAPDIYAAREVEEVGTPLAHVPPGDGWMGAERAIARRARRARGVADSVRGWGLHGVVGEEGELEKAVATFWLAKRNGSEERPQDTNFEKWRSVGKTLSWRMFGDQR